jgi:hypothetical protein
MMVRLLYILGLSAVAAACGVFSRSVELWGRGDPELDRLAERPGVVEAFRQRQGEQTVGDGGQAASPLVAQAEAFAAYLSPPVVAKEQGASVPVLELGTRVDASPPVRPKEVSVDFRVVAVSCYPDRPERSMALIAASSDGESEARWVKEGAGIGHFVVHEIRQGAVVLRDGEQLRELAVERRHQRRTLVRDVRAGTRRVSAAIDGPAFVPSSPAGPNSVE